MLNYISLGIIQGITEFFPVSSSGHLVIFEKLLNVGANGLAVSVVLHLGTVLAVVVFFYRDIIKLFKNIRLMLMAAAVVLITGVIGVLGKSFFEALFNSPKAVGAAWIFTGAILLLTKNFTQSKRGRLNIRDALILGATQGAAIIPGISRSGITISTLLFRGIERNLAFSFSFLVSVPVILGAAWLEAKDIRMIPAGEFSKLGAGFLFSFVSGWLTLFLLKTVIRQAKFYYFGYYCILMAAIALLFIK